MKFLKIIIALIAVLYLTSCSEDGLMDSITVNEFDESDNISNYLKNKNPELGDFRISVERELDKNKFAKTLERMGLEESAIKWGNIYNYDHLPWLIPISDDKSREVVAMLFARPKKNGNPKISIVYAEAITSTIEKVKIDKITYDMFFSAAFLSHYNRVIYDNYDINLINWVSENREKFSTKSNKNGCDWNEVCSPITIVTINTDCGPGVEYCYEASVQMDCELYYDCNTSNNGQDQSFFINLEGTYNDSNVNTTEDPFDYLYNNIAFLNNLDILETTLGTDPLALISNCDPTQWNDLITMAPSQQILDKLDSFGEDWGIQSIEDAAGTAINLDYFGVKINQLPKVNGQSVTADQFLEHIRTNINSFIDMSIADFEPITQFEEDLWLSNSPEGSILTINMDDDGSVICSEAISSQWTFTTLETPGWIGIFPYDGAHPVSGNRQFGIKSNPDGSYTVFTRGADRLTRFYHNWFAGIAFAGADALWLSFLDRVKSFTDMNNGAADPVFEIETHRPDWLDVLDVIHGEKDVSEINCNSN